MYIDIRDRTDFYDRLYDYFSQLGDNESDNQAFSDTLNIFVKLLESYIHSSFSKNDFWVPELIQLTQQIKSDINPKTKINNKQIIAYISNCILRIRKSGQAKNIASIKIKFGVDAAFTQTPELASIGTKEQYSLYLDTVFPHSKVKTIIYHQTSPRTPKLDDGNWKISNSLGAAYFSFCDIYNTGGIQAIKNIWRKIFPERTLLAVVDVRNPLLITKKINKNRQIQDINHLRKKIDLSSNDSVIGYANTFYDDGELDAFPELPEDISTKNTNIEIAIFSSSQIRVLGSESDIEGFRKFMKH